MASGRNPRLSWLEQEQDTIKDHERPESTISLGQGKRRGTCRSLLLEESEKPHEQKIDGIRLWTTTVSVRELLIRSELGRSTWAILKSRSWGNEA